MTTRRSPRSTWLRAAVAACAFSVVSLPAIIARRRFTRVEVMGESMTPALLPGDYLVLRRGAPPRGNEAGHIVATADPRPGADGRLLLKRIIGLPGESLRVGGAVQINGRILREPYAHGDAADELHRGVNRLSPDAYFLLGDHRGASTDSRDFGPVTRDRIEGYAVFRYWPPARAARLHPATRELLGAEPAAYPPSPAAVHAAPLPLYWRAPASDEGKP